MNRQKTVSALLTALSVLLALIWLAPLYWLVMTALTTILGLLPMAIGFGNGAEMVQPVAIVCIGGLLYATAMTLIVVPVMYRLIGRKHMVKIEDEQLEIVNV